MSETNSIAMSPEKEENDAYEAFVAVLRDYMDKLVEWLNESEVQTSKDKTALKEPVAEQAVKASRELFKTLEGAVRACSVAREWFDRSIGLKDIKKKKGKEKVAASILAGMNRRTYSNFQKAGPDEIREFFPIVYRVCSSFEGTPVQNYVSAKYSFGRKASETSGGTSIAPMDLSDVEWILKALLICEMKSEYDDWKIEIQKADAALYEKNKVQLSNLQKRALERFAEVETHTGGSLRETNSQQSNDNQEVISALKKELESARIDRERLEKEKLRLQEEIKRISAQKKDADDAYDKQKMINERLVTHHNNEEQKLKKACEDAATEKENMAASLQQAREEAENELSQMKAREERLVDRLHAAEADLEQYRHELQCEKERSLSSKDQAKEQFLAELIRRVSDSINNFFKYLEEWRKYEDSDDVREINDGFEYDLKEMCDALKSMGATRIGSIGEIVAFDPSVHECDGLFSKGENVRVEMIGWKYNAHIIRKAYVVSEEEG
ncbi:nucleotide exchange factor GrpE [Clostridium fessum]|uniref:nucleotide exchange factor GrpE n=1 Tax=Clostridium fessum TaxID=2126740 RepID=UPI002A83E9E1|nr:nucleotide exchange factor GrpE [Clostridium fessum]MDY4928663.1 nucleotide exchange factor GrpE [Clostridium fessum]